MLKRNAENIRTPEEFNLINRIVAVQEPIAIGCDARPNESFGQVQFSAGGQAKQNRIV